MLRVGQQERCVSAESFVEIVTFPFGGFARNKVPTRLLPISTALGFFPTLRSGQRSTSKFPVPKNFPGHTLDIC